MKKTFAVLVTSVMVLSVLAAVSARVYAAGAYVHLSVTGSNVNIRVGAKTDSKILTRANPVDYFIAEDQPVINPADGSKWYKIIMVPGKDDYIPLAADKRFGVASAYISANFVSITKLTEYGNERITGLLAGAAAANKEQGGRGPKTLPNMKTEADIREYLPGEWNFVNTSDGDYYSCRMVIDKNLKAEIEFYDPTAAEGKKSKRKVTGQFSFVTWPDTGAHEAPDALGLELSNFPGRDDLHFLHRTVFDKRRVMSLFYAGNGDCLFDLLDSSGRYEWGGTAPAEMVFFQETGEEYDFAPRANAEFYAVCWGYGKSRQEGVIWLDDIKWPPPHVSENFDPLYSGEKYYLYETTRYDNETPVSVAYAMADGMKIEGGGDLRYGKVYLVKTNGRGEIANMKKTVYVRAEDSWTALMYAAYRKSALEDVTALIEAGADVNAKNHSDVRDVTVLMCVAEIGSPEVITALIKAGAEVGAKDECGKTALMYAAERNRNPEAISALLKAGADADVRDNDGKIAGDYASENEYIKDTYAFKELTETSK